PAQLLERLDRIERQNKNLKRAVGLLVLTMVALVLMAQAPARQQRTLEAERLILRYPNGNEAIVLGTEPDFSVNSNGLAAKAFFYTPSGVVPGFTVSAGPIMSTASVSSEHGMTAALTTAQRLNSDLRPTGEEEAGLQIYRRGTNRILFNLASGP